MASTSTQRKPTTAPSGLLGKFPPSWAPYFELARVNQPHGILVGLFSHSLGILYAMVVSKATGHQNSFNAAIAGRLLLWLILCRSAACAWNDVVDQDFDRRTERCRNRPIARGALTTADGCCMAGCLVTLAIVPILGLPHGTVKLGFLAVALTTFYPFAKRVTDFPQVCLGFIAGLCVAIGAYAADVDALSGSLRGPTLCLMSIVVLHLVFYDVIYSRQDASDDFKSGVKSMAVLYRDRIPLLLGALALGATVLVSSLGVMLDLGIGYFILAVGGQVIGLGSLCAFASLGYEAHVEKLGGRCFLLAFGSLLVAFTTEVYR